MADNHSKNKPISLPYPKRNRFPGSPESKTERENIWINVFALDKLETGKDNWREARNSLKPETSISLPIIINAAKRVVSFIVSL